MKYVEFKTKMDPKTALIHVFEYYPGKKLMIMVSEELFGDFRGRNDVRRNFDLEHERNLPDDSIVYDLYEDENINTSDCYGTAIFTHICGVWVLKNIIHSIYKYGDLCEEKADLIILIK